MIFELWCRWFGHRKPYKISADVDDFRFVWCSRCMHFIQDPLRDGAISSGQRADGKTLAPGIDEYIEDNGQ